MRERVRNELRRTLRLAQLRLSRVELAFRCRAELDVQMAQDALKAFELEYQQELRADRWEEEQVLRSEEFRQFE